MEVFMGKSWETMEKYWNLCKWRFIAAKIIELYYYMVDSWASHV
jgi:hypothetical protein